MKFGYIELSMKWAFNNGARYVVEFRPMVRDSYYVGGQHRETMSYHFLNEEKKEIGYINEITEFLWESDGQTKSTSDLKVKQFGTPRTWSDEWFEHENYWLHPLKENELWRISSSINK